MSNLGLGRAVTRATRSAMKQRRREATGDWRSRDRDSALTHHARGSTLNRKVFQVVAFAEAFTWAGLLVGMYFKHIAETSEVGVQIFGPLHGAMFLIYLLVAFTTKSVFGWSGKVLLLALVAAVPPFMTVVFERWALARGLLGDTAPAEVPQEG